MDRILVKSSSLRSVGYEGARSVLEIEFNSGGIYHYLGVLPPLHEGLMAASSKGRFFDQRIRDRFQTLKVR